MATAKTSEQKACITISASARGAGLAIFPGADDVTHATLAHACTSSIDGEGYVEYRGWLGELPWVVRAGLRRTAAA